MKKLVCCLFIAALSATMIAPSAHALGAYGIWYMPDKGNDDGFGIGLKKEKSFTPLFSLDGRFSYTSFPDAEIWSAEVSALAHLAMFYGGVGGGYYFFSGDVQLKDAFSTYLLAGAGFGLGGIGVFGELKYQFLEPDLDNSFGGSANLDGIVLHAGAVFNLFGL